jgi:hypothetical protein
VALEIALPSVAAHSSRIARVLPGLENKHAYGQRARAALSLQRNFKLTPIGPVRVDRGPSPRAGLLRAEMLWVRTPAGRGMVDWRPNRNQSDAATSVRNRAAGSAVCERHASVICCTAGAMGEVAPKPERRRWATGRRRRGRRPRFPASSLLRPPVDHPAARPPYERLDQLVVELLLGVR